jgi:hypothetical protein
VVFALFYTSEMPSMARFVEQIVGLENVEFLMAYAFVGFIFASLVFGASVVAIPLMLDRRQDAVTSMLASLIALGHNPGPCWYGRCSSCCSRWLASPRSSWADRTHAPDRPRNVACLQGAG